MEVFHSKPESGQEETQHTGGGSVWDIKAGHCIHWHCPTCSIKQSGGVDWGGRV